ncbi:MAG: lipopolysaccharide biosynthesis protein [Chloroflexota bacterium]
MIERVGGMLRRKFVRDTLTLQIGKVGVLALGLLASVVVPVRMGAASYGVWQLGLSLYGIWGTLNLTGLLPSAQTRLALAVGAEDDTDLTRTLAVFLRVTLLYCAASTVLLALAAPLFTRYLYAGNATVPVLAVLLTLTQPTELLYNLLVITFSSRRQMRQVAVLQNVNQTVLVGSSIIAVLISPTPFALVIARLVYSAITLTFVAVTYQRTRTHSTVTYPSLATVVRQMPRASVTGYWRFGLSNAADKNIATLYFLLPVQMVGVVLGEAAAGFIGLALNIVRQGTFFTAAVMDNMQAVVPQAVGRRAYASLWRNFNRVLLVLTVGGVGFYGVLALIAPFAVRSLYGPEWMPAVGALQALAVFGAVVTVGGVFGPLYRAFDFVRGAFLIKLGALITLLPVGYWLMTTLGVAGGAWLVNLLYTATVVGTAVLTLPELRTRARQQIAA